jgi:hypothetical protein
MSRAQTPPTQPVHPGTLAFAQYGALYAHGDPEAAFLARLAAEGSREPFWPLRMAVSQGAPPPARAEEWLGCPVLTP